MTQREFETMMGISDEGMIMKLDGRVYGVIEEMYMETEEDKQTFCQRVKEENLLIHAAGSVIDQLDREREKLKAMNKEIEEAKMRAETMAEALKSCSEKRESEKNRELELEIIKLKAKLYDYMTKE